MKENYPNVIRDTEINLEELKAVLGLPVDEKVNGYGLNFVGRNFARAKYAKKTEKELRLNTALSKHIDTTQNLVLKGDNLDSLKILKNYYSGQIKCIYIDPPYNTTKDEFVYPDKFDKEEAEVLGLTTLSENDFDRMDFSFKTKKSHNGWLAFLYPRLLLARDLLSPDGAIFISIDDNEQANLKLLCDDVFGEENFVEIFSWTKTATPPGLSNKSRKTNEYILCYEKNKNNYKYFGEELDGGDQPLLNDGNGIGKLVIPKEKIKFNWADGIYEAGTYHRIQLLEPIKIEKGIPNKDISVQGRFKWQQTFLNNEVVKGTTFIVKSKKFSIRFQRFEDESYKTPTNFLRDRITSPQLDKENGNVDTNETASSQLEELFGSKVFDFSKPISLIKYLVNFLVKDEEIILDFFAGSGTTGHAVMDLNKDGGNRKFILCQIDEPIKADKSAYKFCVENNLPPVISSITVERLKRAGEKIAQDIEVENTKSGIFDEDKKQIPDIGFKVFDSIDAPQLKIDDNAQISINLNGIDALSRIYNMIFTLGLDEPTQVPEVVVEDHIYKIGTHYYITNSEKISTDDFASAIKNGKVFIDGWTASLNGTLQNYKEDVKIVF
ncbi:site-specific DNA-methyltransferase [Mucilaginibacter auburnensis]|uniref:site-specific DNA-methyltransferase n=1 Tax=Mucilaginibacter auburnensis TaxID=1457233 RepID=UPI001B80623A|nr:site-specific DNA-methyltransferase [Mucilaginibacter auburnensis]